MIFLSYIFAVPPSAILLHPQHCSTCIHVRFFLPYFPYLPSLPLYWLYIFTTGIETNILRWLQGNLLTILVQQNYMSYKQILMFLCNKTNQIHQIQKFILSWNSTCFRQFICPSSGVHSLYTQQWYMSYRFVDSCQAVPSWSCSKAVYKPVWHVPLLSV